MDFSSIFNIVVTIAIGYISWSLKKFYETSEKRHEKNEARVEELEEKVNDNQKELYRLFITRDEHYRDINALESKIDYIKDILLEIQKEIGKLTGERSGK